jgi:hypothetical protein
MAITRDSILQDIYDSINRGQGYSMAGNGANNYADRSAAINERDRQTQLKYLLNAGFNTGGFGADASGGGGGYVNPFGTGGAGGSGAPTVDNSNRFEAGLSDTETRLRALLDNPDSINQSAAYKFRVGQGQEAINRQLGAKGMLNSGNRLMELTKYGQDMASQEYDAQAGRLGSLLGNYSGSWIGDKNANTARFAATSNAWNTAQGNADRNRLGYAEINAANQRAAMGANSGGGSRTYGVNSGFDRSLYTTDNGQNAWDNQARRMGGY